MIIYVQGTPTKTTSYDFDQDGITGEVETIKPHNFSFQPIQQTSELSEAIKELNRDELEGDTKMSQIDLKTNLNKFVLVPITALDCAVALKVYPEPALRISRQFKRNAVSENRGGRNDMRDISTAHLNKKQAEEKNLLEKITDKFSGKNNIKAG